MEEVLLSVTERFLVHLSDEIVDLVFSVTEVTTFNEVVGDTSVTSSWAGEFESPEEVVGLKNVHYNEVQNTVEADCIDFSLTLLKFGPTVKISWIKSSVDWMPMFPTFWSMTALSERATL